MGIVTREGIDDVPLDLVLSAIFELDAEDPGFASDIGTMLFLHLQGEEPGQGQDVMASHDARLVRRVASQWNLAVSHVYRIARTYLEKGQFQTLEALKTHFVRVALCDLRSKGWAEFAKARARSRAKKRVDRVLIALAEKALRADQTPRRWELVEAPSQLDSGLHRFEEPDVLDLLIAREDADEEAQLLEDWCAGLGARQKEYVVCLLEAALEGPEGGLAARSQGDIDQRVATKMGISVNTVRVYKHQVLPKFRESRQAVR